MLRRRVLVVRTVIGIHSWVHKKPTYGAAFLWIGPLHFRVNTGKAAGVHIEFKIWVNIRRTLVIRRDNLWTLKVLAYKGSFPK